MSTSKKRKLEFLQESSNQCKKRKLSAPTKKIKSIFSHSKDHDEFLKYFHSIQQSSLPHSLNIPSDINKEIAAFSTGLIKKCSGSYCNARICVLNQDWIEFSNDTLSKWTYCSKTDKYFCDMCLPYTTHFHCCDTIQCFKGYRKCVWSGDEIKCRYIGYFDDDVSILSYKCMYCNNDMVWFEICDDCSELSCCYHSWVYKCDANEHNMCCQTRNCYSCNEQFCYGCDGSFWSNYKCDRCLEFWCNECAEAEGEDFFSCDKCCVQICNNCQEITECEFHCPDCGQDNV
eukprot:479768_1